MSRSHFRVSADWARVLVVGLGALALVWPALYNGFPLTFQDSGFYLAGLFDHAFHSGRALGYVYFVDVVALGASLWPVVLVQALITSALVVRSTELLLKETNVRSAAVASIGLGLAAITGAAKYTSWIMADVMTGWIFLGGLVLLLSQSRVDKILAGLIVILSVTAHNTHLPLALGMTLVVLVGTSIRERSIVRAVRHTRDVLGVAVLATIAVPVLGATSGESTDFVRGGSSFLLYKFIDTGVAIETLDRYCDDQDWVSCGYRDEYARHVGKADGWFLWRRASPFYTQMNGWHGDEQKEIVEHAFRCCWPRIVSTTLAGALRQFVRIDSTDGLRPQDIRPAAAFLRRGGSAELASLRSSRQASGTLARPVLHPLPERASFVTVGLAALTLITLMARAGDPRGLWLAAALFLFLAGNATICAFGSTLHARYQSRIAWLVIWMLPILVAWFRARSGSRQIGHSAVAIVSVAIAFAGVGVGCTQEEPPAEPASVPNVLLIVVDTLRADHLSVYGYERPTTPELERYFASADRYVQAYSAATFTSGSVVSMLSGLYPGAHGIRDFYVQVPDEIVLLPDLFSEQGYQTAGIVSNTVLTEEALGLGARFDLFDDFVDERESSRKIYERRATRTTDSALRWLATERDPDQPHLLCVVSVVLRNVETFS